ncbi:hypothetical protein GCM10028791_37170 [Echinicola sediminis]
MKNNSSTSLSSCPSNNLKDRNLIYGLESLASLLGCSIPSAKKEIEKGKIPYFKVGVKYIFDKVEVFNALRKGGIK